MKPFKFNSLFIWSLLGLGGALILFVSGSYFFGRISEAGIIFNASTDASSQTIGLPFDIHVVANNDSDNFLKNVSISLLLPNEAIFASGDDRKINSVTVGDIRPGEIKSQTFSVIILPAENPNREFRATLRYELGTLTANFEKETTVQVRADDFPLTLDITAPESVSAGQEFEVRAKYKNVFSKILPTLKIAFDHSEAFKITSAVPKQNDNGNWNIEGLSAGKEGELSIKGHVNLQEDPDFKFAFRAILALGGFDYDVLNKEVSLEVTPSPLSISISLPEQDASYRPGDTLQYMLNYRNNSEDILKDAAIKVKLNGEMYDLSSLAVKDGSFSNVTRTITWSPTKLRELRSLAPGAGGNLDFLIKVKDSYSIRRINDRDFTVKADASIESSGAIGLSSIESKIAGALLIESAGYFRDADSLILNNGPWPPVVGKFTEFTIHWRIGSYSTNVSNLEVRGRLGEGVIFTGKNKSSNGVLPEIDKDTGQLVWKVDKLLATAGILSAKPELIFQVRATPTAAMAGKYMEIFKETLVRGTDDFTGLEISAIAPPVTTRLENDTSVDEGEGKIR